MTETIGTLLAAHGAGKPLAATIGETYDRIRRHNDPALFIALRPESEAKAIAERLEASGPADKPLYGVPFVVKDNIDVAGLPTTAACPAFAYSPSGRRSSSTGSNAPARLSSARQISISSRPGSSACVRLTAFRATLCAPISSRADRAPARRRRSAQASFHSRSAPTRRDRAACRRRSTALWA